ncbi:aldo/keto reductase family protein [Mycobacterium xenopi 3993]|nr:aldo/keto reductase family protein [Mycobacterium xenopi 3993]
MSLRRLGVQTIDLFQLHRIDDKFPLEDQVGELAKLQQEGKIRHIGLSEISVDQLRAAQQIAPIVSVQNLYNLTNRSAEPLVEACADQGLGFIPWFPLAAGRSPRRMARWRGWRPSTTPRRRRWRWLGCSTARR